MEKIWLTKSDLAKYLSVTTRTIEKRVRDGVLPKSNKTLGERNPRWNKADIDAIMSGENTQSQPTI